LPKLEQTKWRKCIAFKLPQLRLKASTAVAAGSKCHETKQFDYALSLDANKSLSGINVMLVG